MIARIESLVKSSMNVCRTLHTLLADDTVDDLAVECTDRFLVDRAAFQLAVNDPDIGIPFA